MILFQSDYEGIPLSLLEAMSVGVIPIYPRIRSGGDAYVAKVRSDLLYEPEDFGHVAKVLSQLIVLDESALESLRARCKEVTAPHTGDNYIKAFSTFIRQLRELPKASKAAVPRPPRFVENCSFTWLARFGAVRRGFLRLLRILPIR